MVLLLSWSTGLLLIHLHMGQLLAEHLCLVRLGILRRLLLALLLLAGETHRRVLLLLLMVLDILFGVELCKLVGVKLVCPGKRLLRVMLLLLLLMLSS